GPCSSGPSRSFSLWGQAFSLASCSASCRRAVPRSSSRWRRSVMSRLAGFVMTALLLALGAIRQRPVRSLLTAFGILVGIAAVTIVVALAEGAGSVVSGAIDVLGTNSLIV